MMRRSSEPQERAQFTVAELLARYGDPAPAAAGRRHRRADDDRDDGGAADTAAGRGAAQPVAAPPAMERNWTVSSAESTQPRLTGPTLQQWAPAVGPPSTVAASMPVAPPALPRRSPLPRTAPPLEGPVTEQLPRLDQAPVSSAHWSSRRPASANPDTSQPPAGLRTVSRAIAEPTENAIVADEETAQQAGSPLWEWAVMVSQVGIGIVGGAALWLICEWLWQRIPVVALVVALAVITGLVWVVRRVRGAEDLQTTVVAVLVGLFVTVSPAALLLVGR
ncbi:MAG TPA: hypothetical protein VFW64_00500 [Pseudonocardiaceae bacterium]|nr:hypothetical protein [Pseudonocardiaceae bacterium]